MLFFFTSGESYLFRFLNDLRRGPGTKHIIVIIIMIYRSKTIYFKVTTNIIAHDVIKCSLLKK